MIRKKLSRRPCFSVHDAFNICDGDKNGFITQNEFKSILKEHGFYMTEIELQWLLQRYDRNFDGRISYAEFINEILPKSPNKLQQ